MRRLAVFAALVGLAAALAAPAQPPREPKFIDDDKIYEDFYDKLEELAKAKKPLAHDKLVAKMKKSRKAKVETATPGDKVLTPEEVFKRAEAGVFIVGSVFPGKDGNWERGTYATAWVASADGVLVTNWHVFEDLKAGEVFGAADRDGNVYPVTDILGGDKLSDVAVFKIDAKGLKPLPVARDYAEVGSWVGVLSHPGDLFYVYTQGTVTRYSTFTNDDGDIEKWMGITAEYASGSSGGPVLDKYGAVVGMAALTLSIDAADEQPANPARRKPALGTARGKAARPVGLSRADEKKQEKKDDKKDDKPKENPMPDPRGSTLQMVVKQAVPGPLVLKWLGK